MARRLYIRAPNHLGDGVMALPAVQALARCFEELVVAAPRWGGDLYRGEGVVVVPRGEVPRRADAAALLAPSFRAAWEARHLPRVVGVPGDWRRLLLDEAVMRPAGHRALEYAAVAAALGAQVRGPPVFTPSAEEREAADVPLGHLALAPRSASGATVEWGGFPALAASRPDVVVYLGPGEDFEGEGERRVGQPVGLLAACLERARALVGNDSGFSHLARAVGTPTLVVFGSTDPGRTGAAGARAVEGPPLPCRPCYKKRCAVGGSPCLDIPPGQVERALAALERP